jgi:hypothetical protein
MASLFVAEIDPSVGAVVMAIEKYCLGQNSCESLQAKTFG